MTEGIYKQSDKNDPARRVVCPKCCAAIGGSCMEPARPCGMKYIDHYHTERIAEADIRCANVSAHATPEEPTCPFCERNAAEKKLEIIEKQALLAKKEGRR